MIITIFTDASFDPRTRAAGWAAWIKWGQAPNETARHSGAFKEDISDASEAEGLAIANALFIASRILPLSSADWIILQSDCIVAIDHFNGIRKSRVKYAKLKEAQKLVSEIVSRTGIRLELRHVKAHQKGVDRRSAVNEWCDRTAKAARKTHEAAKNG